MLGIKDLSVLLVEDDPEMARSIERVLVCGGHSATRVANVAQARALGDCFDCGVLDIELPDGSGIDLAEDLLDAGRISAVVFYSGCTHAETRDRARRLGPFVDKAAGARELERALMEAVSAAARLVAGTETPQPARRRRTQSGSRRKVTGD